MPADVHFCSPFARQYRPLSTALEDRARKLRNMLASVADDTVLRDDPIDVVALVLAFDDRGTTGPLGDPAPVVITPLPLPQYVGTEHSLRGDELPGEHIPCWRWVLPFEWTGPADVFGRWPDETGGRLAVYDNHPDLGRPPAVKWRRAGQQLVAECLAPRATASDDIDDEAWSRLQAIWEEEQASPPEALYLEAARHAAAYADAVNRQVAHWAARTRRELTEAVLRRRRLLERGRRERDRVDRLLEEWRVPPLEVEVEIDEQARVTRVDDAAPRAGAVLPWPLSDTSLEHIVRVVNRWGASAEKYAATFAALDENPLSDLLTATLNGAFGRADREVFVGGGRCDFLVQSNALGFDGNAEMFVGETKFWRGPVRFLDAVGQALRELTRRTRTAVLVVLVAEHRSFTKAVESALASLDADERTIARAADVAGSPSFLVRSALDPEVSVRLCVVFVDLTGR